MDKIFLVKAIKGDNQEYPLIEPIGEPIELTPQEVELLKDNLRIGFEHDEMNGDLDIAKAEENLLKKLESI